jgi:hypothetical protein
MPTATVEPTNFGQSLRPVFSAAMRRPIAGLLVAGPLLQMVEFLLETGTDDSAARVAFWAAHPTRTGLALAAGTLAVPFLLCGAAVLVALTLADSRRLAWLGGACLTFGLVGLGAAHGYELAAYGLAQSGELAAATAALNGDNLGLPGAVFFLMFLGGAALGTLALAAAAWRSRLVPRIVPVLMLAFAVLDFAAGQAIISHLVNLAGFTVLAAAVAAGYSRQPRA